MLSEEDKQYFRTEFANVESKFEKVESNLKSEIQSLKKELSAVKLENTALRAENQQLREAHDDLEQYGRRMAIRVEGLEYREKEENTDLQATLIEEFKDLGIVITDNDIVRLHRSSKVKNLKKDKNSNETYPTKQCLIKFGNWRAREKFNKFNRNMKNKTHLRVYHDLTKRRQDLLTDARSKIKEGFRRMNFTDEMISQLPYKENIFAFVDINSNLVVSLKGQIHRFNNMDQLTKIINEAFPRPLSSNWGAGAWGMNDIERDFGAALTADFSQQEERSSRFSLTTEQQAAIETASSATGRITRSSSQKI